MESILVLGFLMGMRHALDADHLAAVATLSTRTRSLRAALFQGAAWGLGHTLTLLVIGAFCLLMGGALPEAWGLGLELVVGLMLVFLGAQVLVRMRRRRVHVHVHGHGDGTTTCAPIVTCRKRPTIPRATSTPTPRPSRCGPSRSASFTASRVGSPAPAYPLARGFLLAGARLHRALRPRVTPGHGRHLVGDRVAPAGLGAAPRSAVRRSGGARGPRHHRDRSARRLRDRALGAARLKAGREPHGGAVGAAGPSVNEVLAWTDAVPCSAIRRRP